MSSEEPNLIAYVVNRGWEKVFVGLFGLDGLGIGHLGFQVGVKLIQLVRPFLQSRGGRKFGGFTGLDINRFVANDVSRVLSIQGKKRGNTGGG